MLWFAACAYLALPWIGDLGQVISPLGALLVIFGLALFPGYLNAFLCSSLLLSKAVDLQGPAKWPDITILVPAHNEQQALEGTVKSVLCSDYPGQLKVEIIDDGSGDTTALQAGWLARQDPRVSLTLARHGGKAQALNLGLRKVSTELVATVDADTRLTPEALRRLVSRLCLSGRDTVAAAGAVLVGNPKESLAARLQYWDYQLGIASIKRSQSLWGATLVAQGAFSVYRRGSLLAAGGWPLMIGEDIVLTWSLLQGGGQVTFEPTALAYTSVPTGWRHFVRQRARWARGMIEGLKAHGRELLFRRQMVSHGIGINMLFPLMDLSYVLAFYPGVVLALSGTFLILGPWTLAVLPVNIIVFSVMFHLQRRVFRELGERFDASEHLPGFLLYWLLYQPLLAPVAVVGYLQETLGHRHRW